MSVSIRKWGRFAAIHTVMAGCKPAPRRSKRLREIANLPHEDFDRDTLKHYVKTEHLGVVSLSEIPFEMLEITFVTKMAN